MFLILLVALSASPDPKVKASIDWPLAAAESIPIGYGQLVLHELSHGIYAQSQGATDVGYAFYPHLTSDKTLAIAESWGTYRDLSRSKWMQASAMILDIAEVLTIAAIDRIFHLPSWLRTTLKVIQGAATTDFIYNSLGLWTMYPSNDFVITSKNLGLAPWPARLIGSTIGVGLAGTTIFF